MSVNERLNGRLSPTLTVTYSPFFNFLANTFFALSKKSHPPLNTSSLNPPPEKTALPRLMLTFWPFSTGTISFVFPFFSGIFFDAIEIPFAVLFFTVKI